MGMCGILIPALNDNQSNNAWSNIDSRARVSSRWKSNSYIAVNHETTPGVWPVSANFDEFQTDIKFYPFGISGK